MTNDDGQKSQALYNQVCSQHDGISDFRAKLLALLPIASGAGIFLLFEKDGIPENYPHIAFIGAFGIAVTTGLFFYELRGIQKCIALITAAEQLEQELSTEFDGAFKSKPSSLWGISAETAALIIYPAVIGSWGYVMTFGLPAMLWGDWLNQHRNAFALVRAVIALGIAAFCAFMGAQVLKRSRSSPDLLEVRFVNRETFRAEELRDKALLEPILHEEFWIVRSSGETQTKEQMLDSLASAAEVRRVIRKELFQPCGRAVVALTLIRDHKERVLVGDFWNSKLFVRNGNQWQCKVWQVFRVG